jgi:hypothetical protein
MQNIWKIWLKYLLIYNAKTSTLTKRSKTKIQAVDMKYYGCIERNTGRDRIGNIRITGT